VLLDEAVKSIEVDVEGVSAYAEVVWAKRVTCVARPGLGEFDFARFGVTEVDAKRDVPLGY